ncbi:hypothetical protein LNKW23_36870 [Paralimibaculum aggregatum]|uniref:Exopolysaccharide biosynthesis protein n=1 Tax=Paralimibaculum aggregatum TaxID=3036245 RepID=A0ABQ6LS26_9RHOB|nr:exopolysaccharide biosynthesis protein [Limibaculum sp. NKW23]GMG84471.1 hypothetical protein LNKW23_36870 [Limibaculum sp. NKW23]
MTGDQGHDEPLEQAIDDIDEAVGEDRLRVGTLLDAFEDRSLGFILTVFGLVVSLPVIGALPGLPNVAAIVILLTVFNTFIGGQNRLWAPEILRRQEVSAGPVHRVLGWVRPIGARVDALLGERMAVLVAGRPARIAIAAVAALLAMAMVVLSIVPFLALPASLGIMAFGLALMGRDGLVALLGYLFTGGTLVALGYALDTAF